LDVSFAIGDAREYIAQVRWQFAKTMLQWPHEYTVRERRPDLIGIPAHRPAILTTTQTQRSRRRRVAAAN